MLQIANLLHRLKRKKDRNYLLSVLLFFGIVGAAVWMLYYATIQIDYVWRWYKIPQYFVFHDKIDIKSEIKGEVSEITKVDGGTVIRVTGAGGNSVIHRAPNDSLRVEKGDQVYPGDLLATHSQWKAGILMQGLWITLKVSFIAIIFGILLGLFAGLARISDNPALRWTTIAYIELIRGSPLLVQIFIWYFVLGTLINTLLANNGLSQIEPLWYGVASLASFVGAYVAEIVRAGIQSIHRGQSEASRSLGMTYVQSMIHIILPQAFRRIIPPLAGQFISLIKDSSLLGIISIRELSKATREITTTNFQAFEMWFVCALLYLVLTFSLSMFLQYIERRMLNQ
ncbi:MAG: ABC transporter permease subunit [Thermodesulfobacteriota bacterium]